MAVCRYPALTAPRCGAAQEEVHGGDYCFLVINLTLRPLLACGQCKALHNMTGAAVPGTATSIMDFHYVQRVLLHA